MTRKGQCNWKSNSFVAAAEQVCLQPVLEHWQRRGRRNFAWQAVPHLCSSNRKGTTSDSWPTTDRNVKLFSGGGPEPASVWHVGDTCEWRRTPSKVVRNTAMNRGSHRRSVPCLTNFQKISRIRLSKIFTLQAVGLQYENAGWRNWVVHRVVHGLGWVASLQQKY